jgi:hypothetical protein
VFVAGLALYGLLAAFMVVWLRAAYARVRAYAFLASGVAF